MCQMLHESLNASCSNWLYWVHQCPLWWGPNASHCMCVCVRLTSNAQSDGDQRIATVHTMSHEVILSAPLRLRSLYANVWWGSGLLCKGSTMFYSNKLKGWHQCWIDIQSEYQRPLSRSVIKNEQTSIVCIHFHATALKYSWHRHTLPTLYVHTPLKHKANS